MRPIHTFLAGAVPWPTAAEPGYIGIYRLVPAPNDPAKMVLAGRAFSDFNECAKYVYGMNRANVDLFVGMAKITSVIPSVNRNGKPYLKPVRNEMTATLLSGMWLDVDVKPGAFSTTAEALAAFDAFRAKVGLPLPGFLVMSGSGGFHAHFPFDTPVPVEVWFPLADALKNAAVVEGFAPQGGKLDLGLTTNNACILRIPGTKNFKTPSVPRNVELAYVGAKLPVAAYQAILKRYMTGAVYAARVRHFVPTNPNLVGKSISAKLAGLTVPPLGAGLNDIDWVPSLQEVIDGGCGFLDEARTTRGAAYSEPLWFETVKLAYYMKDGRQVAHDLSDGHPTYSQQGTDTKFDQVVFSHASQNIGWPKCQTIRDAGGTACLSCPHLAKAGSPFNFAQPAQMLQHNNGAPAPPPPPSQPAQPAQSAGVTYLPAATSYGDLPAGYRHGMDGCVHVSAQDPNDPLKTVWELVCPYPIYDMYVQKPNNGVGFSGINFKTEIDASAAISITLKTADLTDLASLKRELSTHGMALDSVDAKKVMGLMVSFTQQLRSRNKVATKSEAYGWSMEDGKPSAFCVGGIRYNGVGNSAFAPPDTGIGKVYTPMGSLDEWKKAAALIVGQNRPALNAIVAASFAAPLVQFTGNRGMVVSAYASASGIGKSHAMRVGQSIWGHPTTGMAGFDDTANYVMERIVKARHFPLMFDELKQDTQHRKLADMVFAVGQGKQKGRLSNAAEMKEVGAFSTLLITASNNSVIEYMNDHVKETVAAINRVFEFPVKHVVDYPGKIDSTVAQRINGTLDGNFGLAGMVYGEHLGKNIQQIDDGIKRVSEAFNNRLKATHDERFGVSTIAILCAASTWANRLGLVQIDVGGLEAFLIERFDVLRSYRKVTTVGDSPDNARRHIVDYLNVRQGNTLTTDEVWTQSNRPPAHYKPLITGQMPREGVPIRVRHATVTRRLRISKSDFNEWVKKERRVAPRGVLETLARECGMVEAKASLTTSTRWSAAREEILEFDLNVFDPFS